MKKLLISVVLFSSLLFGQSGVKPVDNKLYLKECGSCHFAFQAGLLPERSWVKMMNNLENHFDTDATLAKEDYDTIMNYLKVNSSEKAMNYKRSRKMTNSIRGNQTPLKITEVAYFVDKHNEIPLRLITQKGVGTLSNCMACHTTADRGIYSERAIQIPNYGRWDD